MQVDTRASGQKHARRRARFQISSLSTATSAGKLRVTAAVVDDLPDDLSMVSRGWSNPRSRAQVCAIRFRLFLKLELAAMISQIIAGFLDSMFSV